MIKLNVLPCTMEEVMREAWRRLHTKGAGKKKNYNTWVCTTLDRLACKWPQIASSALWWKETGMKEEEIETEPGRRRKGQREREMCEAPERGELHGPPRWCDYHWFTGRTDLHTSLPPILLSRQDGSGRLLNVNISSIRRHGTERNEEPENQALKNEDLDEDILYYSKYKCSQPKCKPWWIQSQISRGLLPSTGQKCNSRGSDYIILTSFLDRKWATGQGFAITAIRHGVKKK